jgi:hypothetical protein
MEMATAILLIATSVWSWRNLNVTVPAWIVVKYGATRITAEVQDTSDFASFIDLE